MKPARKLSIPPDLRKELKANAAARSAFAKLSYSDQKELVRSLEEPKKPETRRRRLDQMLSTLTRGETL